MRVICVIPARMASSRFPGKPLAPILGMPLILHVWHRCRLYRGFDEVVVATCDTEIRDAVTTAGGKAVMTGDFHERATDRTEEAIRRMDLDLAPDDLVVMVQGDEVLMSPAMADAIVASYRETLPPVVNLASPLLHKAEQDDPNTVKVVATPDGQALYFSRAAIPSRSRSSEAPAFQQTGVMGFSASFLTQFGEMAQTPLEVIESVDMMRVIENRIPLKVVFSDAETIGVDTENDRQRAENVLRSDPLTQTYMEL